MTEPNTPDAGATLRDAERAQSRTRAATRWFAGYALLLGFAAFALVVAVEVFFPSGATRAGRGRRVGGGGGPARLVGGHARRLPA